MIYPTVKQLTDDKFNRYELVVAVAKCARIVNDEYLEMRNKAQKKIDNHETEKSLFALIDPEYKDNRPVKIAIAKLEERRFRMARPEEKEQVMAEIEQERAAALIAAEQEDAADELNVADEEQEAKEAVL